MSQPTEPVGVAVHRYGRRPEPAAAARRAATLVLLHGLTDSGRCWPDAVRRWSPSYPLIALDALGHGDSRRFTAAELATDPIQAMYDATVQVVNAEADERGPVVLVGHSMGAGIAAALAAWRPQVVRAAVLEDPAWLRRIVPADQERMVGERVAETRAFRADLVAGIAEGRRRNPGWPAVELEPWARAKADCDEAFLATGTARLATPWAQIAAAIAVSTLVVTGTDNTIVSRVRPELDALGNAHLQVVVVNGAGHCVRRDDPAGYHDAVDPFLGTHASG